MNIHFSSDAMTIFNNCDLLNDELQNLSSIATSILSEYNIECILVKEHIIQGCVLITIFVDKPISEMFDINWALAGILAESVVDMRSDVLIFEYSSIQCIG